MPSVTVDIEVYCDRCGKGLCRNSYGGDAKITVDPCSYCESAVEDEAHDSAYDDGYKAGYEDAKNEFSN